MYAVTRQMQWPDGLRLVEIAIGGFGCAGPGMLGDVLYEGPDPREAASVAIRERKAWEAEDPTEEGEEPVAIGFGSALCYAQPDESDEAVEEWAEERHLRAPKCDECGDILGKDKYRVEDLDGTYCSEYCANKALSRDMEVGDDEP